MNSLSQPMTIRRYERCLDTCKSLGLTLIRSDVFLIRETQKTSKYIFKSNDIEKIEAFLDGCSFNSSVGLENMDRKRKTILEIEYDDIYNETLFKRANLTGGKTLEVEGQLRNIKIKALYQ